MPPSLDLFDGHQYLNIETYRKSGAAVRTPVWFVRQGEALYVWTQPDSGKVKRIRNNPRVRIAPRKADGTPLGPWVPAQAAIVPEMLPQVMAWMRCKYGLAFVVFEWFNRLRRQPVTALRLQLEEVT